ncbi:MAG: heparinase II/III family protein [Armatimonadota bacterium]
MNLRVPTALLIVSMLVLPASVHAQEPKVASLAEMVDAVRGNPHVTESREKLIGAARYYAAQPIIKRPYRLEDIPARWTNPRTQTLRGPRREVWALSAADDGATEELTQLMLTMAAGYRLTGDKDILAGIVQQLEEAANWSPMQRPGWTLYTPSDDPLPADYRDGNWLATGKGIRAIADALDVLPQDSLPAPLVAKLRNLLSREVASIVDDWQTRRPWFTNPPCPASNQWIMPTEGLIRACLVLGKEQNREAYELGVKNLLASLDTQGPQGEFIDGVTYAVTTVPAIFSIAHAMAAQGDLRAIQHPFVREFPTWFAECLQPGRYRINCLASAGDARIPRDDPGFRMLLSQALAFCDSAVARWALDNLFSGPYENAVGLIARAKTVTPQEPLLYADYRIGTRVNWRDSWADDATGVWVRGSHPLELKDDLDRGQVNFIYRGRPVLIEAGAADYSNPNQIPYRSVAGHNVLDVVGIEAKRAPAAITVNRLDKDGGDVSLEPTACYPGLQGWWRQVIWSSTSLRVNDSVEMPQGKPAGMVLRWHLGTLEVPQMSVNGGTALVRVDGGTILIQSDQDLTVSAEKMPDNTVNLGERVGADFLHQCLVVKPVGDCEQWNVTTTVTPDP